MKIRIQRDSVRFRLTRTEVEALCKQGSFKERTRIRANNFVYAVEKSPDPGMSVTFLKDTLTLHVCDQWLEGWDANEQVGFEAFEEIDGNVRLHLLLEKDFVCLDRRLEDQSDNYPNPKLRRETKEI